MFIRWTERYLCFLRSRAVGALFSVAECVDFRGRGSCERETLLLVGEPQGILQIVSVVTRPTVASHSFQRSSQRAQFPVAVFAFAIVRRCPGT